MATESNSSGRVFRNESSFGIYVRYSYSLICLQAALGPIALDLAKKNNDPDSIQWAQQVLTVVVLSILLTAPIGAIGITLGGLKLLPKDPPPNKDVSHRNSKVAIIGCVNQAFLY